MQKNSVKIHQINQVVIENDSIRQRIHPMIKKTLDERRFSVWVSGGEVNDYLLTQMEAEEIADAWRADGYDDVEIEEYGMKTEL